MTRPEESARRVGPLALALLCAACAAPAGPTLEIPTDSVAAEVRFGDTYCRRLESPEVLDDLVAFAADHRSGWEVSWNEPEPPRLLFRLLGPEGAALSLGVGEGQLRTTIGGRSHFQPFSESARRDLLERLGGPPLGTPAIPCAADDEAPPPAETRAAPALR